MSASGSLPLELDLRSDALTQPTEEMWDAMRAARLGWAPAGDDENVKRLEAVGAALLGKEAAIFVPTGTMANLVALMSWSGRGQQIVVHEGAHILWSEEWSAAYVCGVVTRTLDTFSSQLVEAAIHETRYGHRPATALLCLENPLNAAGGAAFTSAATDELCAAAHAQSVPVHLDGARLFNAAVALDEDPARLAGPADSVMVCLNKGLSAPWGALLCGGDAFIDRARQNLRRLGGASLHQAGIAAAAGTVALTRMIDRLGEDNDRARHLADLLQCLLGIDVSLPPSMTNVVVADVAGSRQHTAEVVSKLRERGVGCYPHGSTTVRFVTHRHITDRAVQDAAAILGEVIA